MSELLPLLDRVEQFVREQRSSVAQGDVVKAFPGEPAATVRLSLSALRKQGILDCVVDNGIPYYSIAFPPPRSNEAAATPPLRQESPPRLQAVATPSAEERIIAAMKLEDKLYTTGEVALAAKVPRDRAVDVLRELVNAGRVFGRGQTSGRRYSLKPFPPAPELEPQAVEVARQTESRIEEEDRAREPTRVSAAIGAPGNGATPRFAYWSDGTLELDCEGCSGKLTRRDIDALRTFVNVLPPLAGE